LDKRLHCGELVAGRFERVYNPAAFDLLANFHDSVGRFAEVNQMPSRRDVTNQAKTALTAQPFNGVLYPSKEILTHNCIAAPRSNLDFRISGMPIGVPIAIRRIFSVPVSRKQKRKTESRVALPLQLPQDGWTFSRGCREGSRLPKLI
jgi:hypothetical protein